MLVIDEIRKNGFERLKDELGIKVKESDNFVLLDYCQINSPKTDPIVKECRGLILDRNHMSVACRSFDRFFNYGEGDAQELSFHNAEVVEKVDGSIIRVWHNPYDGKWEVATRGTIFGDSNVFNWDFTFAELFKKEFVNLFCNFSYMEGMGEEEAFQQYFDDFGATLTTHIFEMATKYNRVVTNYGETRIVLLGIRGNASGDYYNHGLPGVPKPKTYNVGSFEEALDAANELPNLEEGFVVRDKTTLVPMCKIKSLAYVAVHHIRGEGLNPKRISQLVWSGETGEYLNYFPEDFDVIDPYVLAKGQVINDIIALYTSVAEIEVQKDFALAVIQSPYKGVMFELRKGKTLKEILFNVNDTIKKEWLEAIVN